MIWTKMLDVTINLSVSSTWAVVMFAIQWHFPKNVFGRSLVWWMLKRIRRLMYVIAMEFPIFSEWSRGRKGGISKIRGINACEYIPSVILETDIHDSLCPHVHSPPVLSSFIHFLRPFRMRILVLFPYPTAGYDSLII